MKAQEIARKAELTDTVETEYDEDNRPKRGVYSSYAVCNVYVATISQSLPTVSILGHGLIPVAFVYMNSYNVIFYIVI